MNRSSTPPDHDPHPTDPRASRAPDFATPSLYDSQQYLGPQWGKSANSREEIRFLEGPQPRRFELGTAFRVFFQFLKGFRALHFVGPCVTVFGSARFREDHPYYKLAREVGAHLAEAGFTVMTGGGPGVMEAANRGAKDVGGRSVGCNIELPREQRPNPYLDRWVTLRYFFVRKVMLVKYSYAFVVLPGGFGTLDEVFETLTLVQTEKIKQFPVVLIGKEFWQPMEAFIRETLLRAGTIDEKDARLIVITDSPLEAVKIVHDSAVSRFGLKYGPRMKRQWLLGEHGLHGAPKLGADGQS